MPIPKSRERTYGIIVGSLQNKGFSLAEAKKKADKALKDHPRLKDSNLKGKYKKKRKVKK